MEKEIIETYKKTKSKAETWRIHNVSVYKITDILRLRWIPNLRVNKTNCYKDSAHRKSKELRARLDEKRFNKTVTIWKTKFSDIEERKLKYTLWK